MVYKKRAKRVYKRKSKIVRKKKMIVSTRNQMPVPLQCSSAFVLEFSGLWDTNATTFAPYLMVNANTIIPVSGSGPLLSSLSAGNRFTGTAVGAGNAFDVTTTTFPTGFQNYMGPTASTVGMYSRYTVTGVKYRWTCTPQDNSSQTHLVVVPEAVATYNSATLYGSVTEMQNAPYAKSKRVTGNNSVSNNTITGYIDIAKFLGISKTKLLTDTSYSGYVFTSGIVVPGIPVNLTFASRNNLGVAPTLDLPYNLELKYYITFSQTSGKLLAD